MDNYSIVGDYGDDSDYQHFDDDDVGSSDAEAILSGNINNAQHGHGNMAAEQQALAFNSRLTALIADPSSTGARSADVLQVSSRAEEDDSATEQQKRQAYAAKYPWPSVVNNGMTRLAPIYGPRPGFASLDAARQAVRGQERELWFPKDRSVPDDSTKDGYTQKAWDAVTDVTGCDRPVKKRGEREMRNRFLDGGFGSAFIEYKIKELFHKTKVLHQDGCQVGLAGDRAYDETKHAWKEGFDMSFDERWDAICEELKTDKKVVDEWLCEHQNDYYTLILYPKSASAMKKKYKAAYDARRKNMTSDSTKVPSEASLQGQMTYGLPAADGLDQFDDSAQPGDMDFEPKRKKAKLRQSKFKQQAGVTLSSSANDNPIGQISVQGGLIAADAVDSAMFSMGFSQAGYHGELQDSNVIGTQVLGGSMPHFPNQLQQLAFDAPNFPRSRGLSFQEHTHHEFQPHTQQILHQGHRQLIPPGGHRGYVTEPQGHRQPAAPYGHLPYVPHSHVHQQPTSLYGHQVHSPQSQFNATIYANYPTPGSTPRYQPHTPDTGSD